MGIVILFLVLKVNPKIYLLYETSKHLVSLEGDNLDGSPKAFYGKFIRHLNVRLLNSRALC